MNFKLWEATEVYLKALEYSEANPEDKNAVSVLRETYHNLQEICKTQERNIKGVLYEFQESLKGIYEA